MTTMVKPADRHKSPLISLRLPAGDRSWVLAHAEETGQSVNAILAEALAAHRKRVERASRRAGSAPAG